MRRTRFILIIFIKGWNSCLRAVTNSREDDAGNRRERRVTVFGRGKIRWKESVRILTTRTPIRGAHEFYESTET